MLAATKSSDFVISRVFDAPPQRLWEMFTDPEHMKNWWGPKGSTIVAAKMDLRPGGTYHAGMRGPDGNVMWGKFVYREIVPPQRLVFVQSFSDENGGQTRHPLSATWPLEMLTTVTFEPRSGGRTLVTLVWSPLGANDQERATFDAATDGMHQGWTGTFEKLTDYLKNSA